MTSKLIPARPRICNLLPHRLVAVATALAALTAAALAGGTAAAQAAPGALDPTFGSGGVVLTDLGISTVEGVEVQPDGRVLALNSGFDPQLYQRVERYLPDGTPDISFGGDGIAEPLVSPGFWTHGFTLQPDGKIVVIGYSAGDLAIARLMPNGDLDSSFDGDALTGNGIVHTFLTPKFDEPEAVAVDKQGRIVFAATSGDDDVVIVRYLSDGKLDTTLAGDGTLVDPTPAFEEVQALAVQDDGLLVAGIKGDDSFVARYTEQGAVDTGFAQAGRRIVDVGSGQPDTPESLLVQSDGTILLGARVGGPVSNPVDRIVALTPAGAPDTSFGNGGSAPFDGNLNEVRLTGDDKVVFTGSALLDDDGAFAVGRLNADGTPDSSFGGGAPVLKRVLPGQTCYAEHLAIAPDGKIVLAGQTYNADIQDYMVAMLRYQVDPDPQPAAEPPAATPEPPAPLALSGLRVTRRSFVVARRSTPAVGQAQAARMRKPGTAFVFTLNRAATVRISIKRLRRGAKVVKLKRTSGAGGNRVRFTGRVGRRTLRPGRYRATLTAVDATGAKSQARAVAFRIVRR
ncbi:MAG TPA: hypothetical protein VF056_02415 [Thermoleophilaceae bacterium]